MMTGRAIVLAGALLALAGARGGPADDPEPPPPIKVENALRASVTVTSGGANGPVLKITTTMAKAKGKGKGKAKAVSSSFDISFTEKQAPTRLTFQFKSHDRLNLFFLRDSNNANPYEVRLQKFAGNAKEVFHFDATSARTTDEKAAALTLTFVPGKEHLEVRMQVAKGKMKPTSPIHVSWRGPAKK
jgi:hypothetical protein